MPRTLPRVSGSTSTPSHTGTINGHRIAPVLALANQITAAPSVLLTGRREVVSVGRSGNGRISSDRTSSATRKPTSSRTPGSAPIGASHLGDSRTSASCHVPLGFHTPRWSRTIRLVTIWMRWTTPVTVLRNSGLKRSTSSPARMSNRDPTGSSRLQHADSCGVLANEPRSANAGRFVDDDRAVDQHIARPALRRAIDQQRRPQDTTAPIENR